MALASAEKQRKYRQRKAIERVGNGYTVTLLKQECHRLGRDRLLDELNECAEMVYDAGGNGALFLERVAVVIYGVLCSMPTPTGEER
jgi:hypothetical protein